MKIMQDVKDEIKARLPVEDVVGQYIELKRAGKSWKGRSPWGTDRTPSFMVSPDKGIWHDFSANKGGDIFSFVMEVEGISFKEALEKLAAQAGVELTKYSGGDAKVAQRKARMREALELACKFYQVCLTRNKEVAEYVFYKRNMNRATATEFRIGYAPQGKGVLVEFLRGRGFTMEEMRDAGLLNQYDGDLFRGRMMVPFFDDATGAIIGFTGRVIKDGEPKYLNTPETLLFNKGRFCFGLRQAKEAIRKSGFAVIVEGNMDVISSHQAGVKEAVATSGTAMTENHLKMLSRLTDDIRLAYDGDAAGVKATERAIELAGGLGLGLSVISGYHEAKDPDELIRKDPALWRQCVEEREPAVDWILKKYEMTCDLNSGPGKRQYSDEAMKIIRMLPDRVEQRHYEQLVAEKLGVSVEDLLAKKIPEERRRLRKIVTTGGGLADSVDSVGREKAQRMKSLKNLQDRLEAILVYGGEAGNEIDLEIPDDETRLAELELIYTEKYEGMTEGELREEAKGLMGKYMTERGMMRIAELTAELEECADDDEKTTKILREITRLKRK